MTASAQRAFQEAVYEHMEEVNPEVPLRLIQPGRNLHLRHALL